MNIFTIKDEDIPRVTTVLLHDIRSEKQSRDDLYAIAIIRRSYIKDLRELRIKLCDDDIIRSVRIEAPRLIILLKADYKKLMEKEPFLQELSKSEKKVHASEEYPIDLDSVELFRAKSESAYLYTSIFMTFYPDAGLLRDLTIRFERSVEWYETDLRKYLSEYLRFNTRTR